MLFTLIAIFVLIIGLLIALVGGYDEFRIELGSIICGIALAGLFICGVIIIGMHINTEAKIEKTEYKQEMLEYRLEHRGENQVGNEMLMAEVMEWNEQVIADKKIVRNPWVNWFYNAKVIDAERIIEVGEYKPPSEE